MDFTEDILCFKIINKCKGKKYTLILQFRIKYKLFITFF